MAEKKYYWLKLKEGFFEQKIIKKLRKIAGGDTYVIIYLKMQLLGLRSEGKFVYEGIGDDFIEELAMELEEDEENVRVTLMYLEKAGIIEILSDNQYFMPSLPFFTPQWTPEAVKPMGAVTPPEICFISFTPC